MALAENAGLDPIEMIMKLRASHEKEDGKWTGINVFTGDIDDMMKLGVIEPVSIKANAIKAGTEAATIVLRIDDVIAASKVEKPEETGKKPGEGGEEE
jgi:chaperonin GroEL (HSP60 family)